MIQVSLNEQARVSGTAVANIGELYANYGLLGIVVGMYLFGWMLSFVKSHYLDAVESNRYTFLRFYAVLYPLLFQWIARGNFCGNFYLTLFALLPFIIGQLINKQHS
jgi:hypothetical protein